MENTSKALLIVAAVLVIILIITIGIKIFSSSSNVSKTSKDVGKTIDEKTAIAMGTMPSTSNSEIQERQVPTIDGTDSDNEEFENISLQQGQTAVENSPYISDGKKAIIPKGFTVSNVEGETSIDTGLVVRDSKNNEWVWIPVTSEDLLRMYVESNTGWKMSGTDVVTEYKSNYDVYTGKARATPGATGWKYREPDILVDTQDGDLRNTYNISNAGLGRNITEMATNLKNDYKNMIDSIKKYGGFYVARYELSKDGIKKGKDVYSFKDWYYSYKKCKEFSNDIVESRMVWGCQWDQICIFISTYGDKVDIFDSRTYGRYSNSTYQRSSDDNFVFTTGYSEIWKTNNIYDLAGNCYEWTQEAFGTNSRVICGGSSNTGGSRARFPVISKASYSPYMKREEIATRPTLYIK